MFTDAISIGILIAALSSGSFKQRQAATEALAGFGERAECHLLVACMSSDPEVRRRAECLRGALLPGKLDRLFVKHSTVEGGLAWADSLPTLHPRRHCLYSQYASDSRVIAATKTEEQKHYPAYRAVTRIWIVDSVYSGEMTLQEADDILGVMSRRCSLWAGGKWLDEASEE